MLADELDYVLGVDTHRDEHVLAVVTAPAGAIVAGRAAPTNAHGYRALLRVADHHAPGRRAWAIEGTGSYGAGLRRYLHARGESVLEVSRSRAVSADSVAKTTGWTRRIQAATLEAAELEQEILGHVCALAPTLLAERFWGGDDDRSTDAITTPPPATTSPAASLKVRPHVKRHDSSSATSLATSTDYSNNSQQ